MTADFITGVFHWLEDSYLDSEDTFLNPFLRKVAKENDLHHERPLEMIKNSWFNNLLTTIPITCFGLFVWYSILRYNFVLLCILVASCGNLVHRWTHDPERPWIIEKLQEYSILQTPQHHRKHHYFDGSSNELKRTKNYPGQYYCAMSNILNPILEKLNLWRYFEEWIEQLFGIAPVYKIYARFY